MEKSLIRRNLRILYKAGPASASFRVALLVNCARPRWRHASTRTPGRRRKRFSLAGDQQSLIITNQHTFPIIFNCTHIYDEIVPPTQNSTQRVAWRFVPWDDVLYYAWRTRTRRWESLQSNWTSCEALPQKSHLSITWSDHTSLWNADGDAPMSGT